MAESPIEVSVQAQPRDAASWRGLARRCEAAGVRALLVADHPGTGPSPFVALAAAAAVTTRLRLGTYVVNAGVREAIHIATDAATLDLLSDGRAELGLGAGHTPAEWESVGRSRPGGLARARRLVAVAAAVQDLLAGKTVAASQVDALADLQLLTPRPVQQPIPLLVGGTSATILRWGGAHAQAVGLTGLGVTGPDGHSHPVNWTDNDLERHLAAVHDGATAAHRPLPAIEVLVQAVEVTDDAEATAAALASEFEVSPSVLLATPFALIGTPAQIQHQLHAGRTRWGITRWVIREAAFDALEPHLAALTSTTP